MTTVVRYPTAEELARSLGGKRAAKGWMAQCPAHEDRHASLSISESDDGTRVLWKCHAKCPQDDVKRALIARGVWPEDGSRMEMVQPRPRVKPVEGRREVAVYQYRDADGTVVHETVRYEPKDFRQRAIVPGKPPVWSLSGVETVLYRLPELLASDGPVWIVEGEKDADNLASTGATVTTVPMGAGKWKPHYGEWLRGRDVRIVPDNDEAGRLGARAIAKALAGVATSVVIVTLPVDGKGADVSDYLADGGTLADLEALVADASATESVEAVPEPSRPVAQTGDGLPLTDLGNAERLLRAHGTDLRYCVAWKSWLVWSGTHWERDAGDHEVRRRAVETVLDLTNVAAVEFSPDMPAAQRTALVRHSERSQSVNRVAAMVDMARSRPNVIVGPDQLDDDPYLVNFGNGTLNLKSGDFRTQRREDRITRMIRWNGQPSRFDPDLESKPNSTWERFVARVLPDPEVRRFAQMAMGYTLIGDTSERIMLILYGTGRNGKSTFIETCQAAFGEYSLTVPSSLFLASKDTRGGGSATPDIASLYRARLVTSQETPEGGRLDEARVKWITGDDTISARRLYEAPFTFQPSHTVWLSTNHRPVVRGGGHALWDRMRSIPFTERIRDNEVQGDLKKRLRDDLAAVMAWIVDGTRDYHREGRLIVPRAVEMAGATYREDSDWFGGFLEARCIVDDDETALAGELHKAYNAWASESSEKPMTPTALGNALRERGMVSFKTGHGARAWRGIGLIRP